MNDHISPIEKLLDENNRDNIILCDERNEPVEFEQIAVIPLDWTIYAILHPVIPMPGMAENEALVFAIEGWGEDAQFRCDLSKEIIDRVFAEYYKMLGTHP